MGSGNRPTIHDVARYAAVSVGTVSNVVNGTRGVSEARRERVLAAIEALGYVPDRLAQSLRTQTSRVIGLCLPHTASGYFVALLEAFESDAKRRDYQLMQVFGGGDPETEFARVRALLAHRVAGIIFIPSFHPGRAVEAARAAGVPVVLVDRPFPELGVDQVTFDNRAAMREATAQLLARGHRRILYVARYPNLVVTRQRIESFRSAMTEGAGQALVMESGETEDGYVSRLAALLRGPSAPSAVIASNSLLSLWTIRTFQLHGIRCPDDVSLLAFDEPEWADVMRPRMSIVRHPTREIARAAWSLLSERIAGREDPPADCVLSATVELHASVADLAGSERPPK